MGFLRKGRWALLTLSFLLCASGAQAAFTNYNNVLIGEKAVGMGGAFTGLTGDPAACAFYNPATLARMEGTSLSATATLYHKFDTNFGDARDFSGTATRVNQGSFRSIPSASGSIAAFGPFAFGLSVIVPDYDFFSGSIQSTPTVKTYTTILDESLWVGPTLALNLTERHSAGVTFYYTARYFQNSTVDELKRGDGTSKITSLEKSFTNNSIAYLLGYYYRHDENWSLGTSVRFPSLEVSGRGTVYSSSLDTQVSQTPTSQLYEDVPSETRIPYKISFGVAHTRLRNRTISLNVDYYGAESYDDMSGAPGADRVEHRPIVNVALGTEYYVKHWLRLRGGLFSNQSSQPPVGEATYRRKDHIDMWGFSANVGIFTSDKVAFTFGGFYTGGKGESIEATGDSLKRIPKSLNIFSMMIGSSYYF